MDLRGMLNTDSGMAPKASPIQLSKPTPPQPPPQHLPSTPIQAAPPHSFRDYVQGQGGQPSPARQMSLDYATGTTQLPQAQTPGGQASYASPSPYPAPGPGPGPYGSRPAPPPLQPVLGGPDVRSPSLSAMPAPSPFRQTPTGGPMGGGQGYPFPPTQPHPATTSPVQRHQTYPPPSAYPRGDSFSQPSGPPSSAGPSGPVPHGVYMHPSPLLPQTPPIGTPGGAHPILHQRSQSTHSTPTPTSAQSQHQYGQPYAQGSPVVAHHPLPPNLQHQQPLLPHQPPPQSQHESFSRQNSLPPTPLGPPLQPGPQRASSSAAYGQPTSPYPKPQRLPSGGSFPHHPPQQASPPPPAPPSIPRLPSNHSIYDGDLQRRSQSHSERERSQSISPRTRIPSLPSNAGQPGSVSGPGRDPDRRQASVGRNAPTPTLAHAQSPTKQQTQTQTLAAQTLATQTQAQAPIDFQLLAQAEFQARVQAQTQAQPQAQPQSLARSHTQPHPQPHTQLQSHPQSSQAPAPGPAHAQMDRSRDRAVTPGKRKMDERDLHPDDIARQEARPPPFEGINGSRGSAVGAPTSPVATRRKRRYAEVPRWAQSYDQLKREAKLRHEEVALKKANFVLRKPTHAHSQVNGKREAPPSRHGSPEASRVGPTNAAASAQAPAAAAAPPGPPQELSTLGPWEPTINNMKPREELTKAVADFLYFSVIGNPHMGEITSRGIQFEIEAKLGTCMSKDTNERVKLPIASECVLESSNRLSFQSTMTEEQHQRFNAFLNEAVRAAHQRNPEAVAAGRVHIDYKHSREVDKFYELPREMQDRLPACIRNYNRERGRHNAKVRVTYEQQEHDGVKTLIPKAQILKARVNDFDLHFPLTPLDCRISVNLEMPWDGPLQEIERLGTSDPRSSPDRNKDRLSYKQGPYQIDLTQVTQTVTGLANSTHLKKEHELEIELSPESLLKQGSFLINGQRNNYSDLVEGLVDNVRMLVRQAEKWRLEGGIPG